MSRTIKIAPGPSEIAAVRVGNNQPLLIIAGPCQIESFEHCMQIGTYLKRLCQGLGFNYVFKSSFDKANRTSLSGRRGVGIIEGLKILSRVRKELGVPVLTDVHSVDQVPAVAEVVDVVQTPAFLCRQTDLLIAVGAAGKAVNVKKGQFLAPEDMRHVAAKISSHGNHNIMLCERGSCFGYRDLVVDMRSLLVLSSLNYPVIFDATHSVQSMGGSVDSNDVESSGGRREFVAPLARAAVATGVDGIFFECHQDPDNAPSDGASMLRLEEVEPMLQDLNRIRAAVSSK